MSEALSSALALLACPVCWKPLVLTVTDDTSTVTCTGCGRRYPVVDQIPILIPDRSV